MIKIPRALLERIADYLRTVADSTSDDFWAADILEQVEAALKGEPLEKR